MDLRLLAQTVPAVLCRGKEPTDRRPMASPPSLKTHPGAMALHPWFLRTGGVSRVRLAYIHALVRHRIGRLVDACGRVADLVVCIGLLPLGAALCIAHIASLVSGGGLRGEDYIGRDGKNSVCIVWILAAANAPVAVPASGAARSPARGPRTGRASAATPARGAAARSGVLDAQLGSPRHDFAILAAAANQHSVSDRTGDRRRIRQSQERAHGFGHRIARAPAALYGSEAREAPSIVPVLGSPYTTCACETRSIRSCSVQRLTALPRRYVL